MHAHAHTHTRACPPARAHRAAIIAICSAGGATGHSAVVSGAVGSSAAGPGRVAGSSAADKPLTGGGKWQPAQDSYLWAHRNDSTAQLAAHFGRGNGGITSRLKHLRNPNHAAYQRLHGSSAVSSSAVGSSAVGSSAAGPGGVVGSSAAPQVQVQALPPQDVIDVSTLTAEQTSVARRVMAGENVFLTGPAGTGKSYLFKYLIQELKKIYDDKISRIAVTAPTGRSPPSSHFATRTLSLSPVSHRLYPLDLHPCPAYRPLAATYLMPPCLLLPLCPLALCRMYPCPPAPCLSLPARSPVRGLRCFAASQAWPQSTSMARLSTVGRALAWAVATPTSC